MNIDRDTAIGLLNRYITTEHIMAHSFAVEAVMRALAKRLDPADEELWGITGLLHDLDMDGSNWQEHPERHGPVTVELLKEHNFGCEETTLLSLIIPIRAPYRKHCLKKRSLQPTRLPALSPPLRLFIPIKKLRALRLNPSSRK